MKKVRIDTVLMITAIVLLVAVGTGAFLVGQGHTPLSQADAFIIEEAKRRLRVADVDRKEHATPLLMNVLPLGYLSGGHSPLGPVPNGEAAWGREPKKKFL